MAKFILIAAAVLMVAILGGAAFLMVWDIPAPSAHVERVIPDAKFPK
jgi:small neutral amino acid transporter SnatA (MarC family)